MTGPLRSEMLVRESGSPDPAAPLDAAMLVGVDGCGDRFPVLSFSSPSSPLDGVVVLFFEGTRKSDEETECREFWRPRYEGAALVMGAFARQLPPTAADHLPVVVLHVRDGRLLPGFQASPAASRRRGPLFDRVVDAVGRTVLMLLERARPRPALDTRQAALRRVRLRLPVGHVVRSGDPRLRLLRSDR